MQELKMIPCPKCKQDFPELRKTKYGYNFCVDCSTIEAKVGITTVEGVGDHTWNGLIILEQSTANAIAKREAEIRGKKFHIPSDVDSMEEFEVDQVVRERISKVLEDDSDTSNDSDSDNGSDNDDDSDSEDID